MVRATLYPSAPSEFERGVDAVLQNLEIDTSTNAPVFQCHLDLTFNLGIPSRRKYSFAQIMMYPALMPPPRTVSSKPKKFHIPHIFITQVNAGL